LFGSTSLWVSSVITRSSIARPRDQVRFLRRGGRTHERGECN
jgi:hypothetical protein